MSCCTIISNKSNSQEKSLALLEKHFDDVSLVDLPKYRLLILRDKANKPNYDYINWLEVRVSYGSQKGHIYHDDDYMLENICVQIDEWVELLKALDDFKDDSEQLSLFGELEDASNIVSKQDKKKQLMKQYSFFELINISYFTYSGIDYRKELPSLDEMRSKLKQALIKGKDNPGRYDEFWFDTPSYLTRDGALSDIELKDRLSTIRLFVVPYVQSSYVFLHYEYEHIYHERKRSHKYYLDVNRGILGPHDNDKLDLPSYDDLIDADMLEFVRELFSIAKVDEVSDKEIVKLNVEYYLDRYVGSLSNILDWREVLNNSKNAKQFQKTIENFIKEHNPSQNGGGSGFSIDGFNGSFSLDRKGSILITQSTEIRLFLNRDCDLELDEYSDKLIIANLNGKEIYEKAFELLKKDAVNNQLNLFDFIA